MGFLISQWEAPCFKGSSTGRSPSFHGECLFLWTGEIYRGKQNPANTLIIHNSCCCCASSFLWVWRLWFIDKLIEKPTRKTSPGTNGRRILAVVTRRHWCFVSYNSIQTVHCLWILALCTELSIYAYFVRASEAPVTIMKYSAPQSISVLTHAAPSGNSVPSKRQEGQVCGLELIIPNKSADRSSCCSRIHKKSVDIITDSD